MNNTSLVGRLTKDPDLRYTPNGVAVANFTIAVNRPFTDQQGNREADFINCVVWRRPAENLANFMKKGSQIGVTGRIQTRTFEGQDGKTVFVTEVVADQIAFLESKSQSNSNSNNTSNNQTSNQTNKTSDDPFKNNGEPIDLSDDDLPF